MTDVCAIPGEDVVDTKVGEGTTGIVGTAVVKAGFSERLAIPGTRGEAVVAIGSTGEVAAELKDTSENPSPPLVAALAGEGGLGDSLPGDFGGEGESDVGIR